MDDRELEARLGMHLHERFDTAPVPGGLAAVVREAIVAAPTSKVGSAFRPRARQLGWLAPAALAVVVAGVLLVGRGLGPTSPGVTQSPSPTTIPTLHVIAERWFTVLPPNGTSPSAEDRTAAAQVLMDRLMRLALKGTSSEAPGLITLTLDKEGLPDDDIRRILAATGDVEFVPLPPDVDGSSLVGKPIPANLTPLFDNEGIASAAHTTTTQGLAAIDISFTPAATSLFADYSTNHTHEYFAVVIDGIVALAPIVNEPVTGGQVSITGGGGRDGGPNPFLPDTSFDVAAAILVGGRLPDSWKGPHVDQVLTRDEAIAAARASGHAGSGDIEGASLEAAHQLVVPPGAATSWAPVWRISYADGAVVTLDATTGAWLSTGIP